MSKLVIVESNAKCKKIESFLGKGYKVIASFGHIRGITDGLKSISIENNYKPVYNILPTKKKYVANLKKAIKSSKEVILATDDDREGEAIAWHICKHFNLPLTTKRIKFREITKPAVKRAIENPGVIDINKFNSQQGRQVLDLIVGYKLSPLLWKHISRNSQSGLSAGRCQTPALRLVYEREMEINESKGRKVYDTVGTFSLKKYFKNLEFNLNHNHKNEKEMETFLEDSVEFEHILEVNNVVEKQKKSPKPFTTSLLQQKSSNELHVSPKQTMRLAQTLYEHGWITYMRTDCDKYSKEFISKAKEFIVNNYGSEYYIDSLANQHCLKKEKSKDNNAQEAHEAIRPTDVNRTAKNCSPEGKIGDREIRLYKLIWNNTLESLLPYARYNSVTGIISAPDKHTYRNTEEEVKYPGWKIVRSDYDNKNPTYRMLKQLIDKETVIDYDKINSKVTIKDLKMHYTEAKLVQLLEKRGIGRPSTFSSLIDKIQERKYVLKQDVKGKEIDCIDFELEDDELEEIHHPDVFGNERNKLVIQPLGTMVLEFLLKYFDNIFDYDYTKNMENYLDDIEKGKMLWHNLCSSCDDEIRKLSKEVKGRETYKIDEKHTYMIGKYGPVIKCDEGDNKVTFKNVKKNLDMNKLKNGEYKLKDILEDKKRNNDKILGEHESKEVILKNGKYGLYINWNGKNHSIKHIKKDANEIKLEDIIDILNKKDTANPNILKILSKEISIRKGKYGPYVMYKTKMMKKPKFIKIKGIEIDDITIEWVYDQM